MRDENEGLAMMLCPNCKAVVDDDALFCPHCAFNVGRQPRDGGAFMNGTPKYFYFMGTRQVGPIEHPELVRLLEAGSLPSTTYVWRQGAPNWTPAGATPGLSWVRPGLSVTAVAAQVQMGYRCPFCEADQLPLTRKRISGGGWLAFGLLLITGVCLPICWLPLLLMKENYTVCRVCGASPSDADIVVSRARVGRLD